MIKWNQVLRKSPRVLSVLLSVAMGMSMFGSFARTARAAENTAGEEQVLTDAEKALLAEEDNNRSHAAESGKEETVYVLADARGSSREIIVSEWLKNREGKGELSDRSSLTDIENVEGYETFTRKEDGTMVWAADGNDIYYRGKSDRALPVGVKVSYKLDGKEIAPEDLAGKSGRVTIRFDYENHETVKALVNGKTEEIYVPFAMVSGCLLPSDRFSNIEVTNGRVFSEGENSIVAGLAFPGLKESLDLKSVKEGLSDQKMKDRLDEMEEDIPDYVEISADTSGFELGMTMTMAGSDLMDQLDLDLDLGSGSLKDSVSDLEDATDQLIGGAETLKDGTSDLKEGTSALSGGAGKLDQGAGVLKDGSAALAAGAEELSDGADTLKSGTRALSQGTSALAGGVPALSDGIAQLKEGAGKLNAGTGQLSDGANALSEGAATVDQSLRNVLSEVEKENGLVDGTKALDEGLGRLLAGIGSGEDAAQEGPATLYAGAARLMAAGGQLSKGAADLKDGAKDVYGGIGQVDQSLNELSDGLDSISEGTQALQEALEGNENTPGLVKGTEAVYQGLSKVNDSVKAMDQGLSQALGTLDPEAVRKALSSLSGIDAEDTAAKAKALSDGAAVLGSLKNSLYDQRSQLEYQAGETQKTMASQKKEMDEAFERMNQAMDSVESSKGGEAPAAPSEEAVQKALENLEAQAQAGLNNEGQAIVTEKSIAGRDQLESALKDYVAAVKDYSGRMQAYAGDQKTDNGQAKENYRAAREEYLAARNNYMLTASRYSSMQGSAAVLSQMLDRLSGFDTASLSGAASQISGLLSQLAELKGQADQTQDMLEKMDQLKTLQAGLHALSDQETGIPYLLSGMGAVKDGIAALDDPQNVPALNQGAGAAADGLDRIIAAIESADDPETEEDETGLLEGAKNLYNGAATLSSAMDQMDAGTKSVTEAVQALSDGAKALKAGSGALKDGANALDQGLGQLQKEGTSKVAEGASGIKDGAAQLKQGAGALDQGISALNDKSGELINGVNSLNEGAGKVDQGMGALKDGIGSLEEGARKLDDGAGSLKEGTASLAEGAGALDEGAGKLDDGVLELLEGLMKYKEEGIDQIADLFGDCLTTVSDRLEAIRKASGAYTSYGGALEDENNQVRFIFRTDAISKDED